MGAWILLSVAKQTIVDHDGRVVWVAGFDRAVAQADTAGVEHGVIIGGDMNVRGYIGVLKGERPSERATAALFAPGYADAHASLAVEERITTDSSVAIDLVFGRGVRFTGAGLGPREAWGGLSDHLPAWARVRF
jgi:hypothetical protein